MVATPPVQFAHAWQSFLNNSWAETHSTRFRAVATSCVRDGGDTWFRCTSTITDRRQHRTVCVEAVLSNDGVGGFYVWGNAKRVPCKGVA
jgi:hypothetical protein